MSKNSGTGRSQSIGVRALLMGGVSAMALASFGAQAQNGSLEEIVVRGDPVGLFEDRDSSSVFGLGRSPLETPRSFSTISDITMERFGIEDIDDFITTTPGTYGGSFFGVPGVVSIRGDKAENYFRGFKRATNNGFYPTPVGASSHIEIIRGPVPAIYGAGRIGGIMNFNPRTTNTEGLTADDGMQGSVKLTGGSYSKKNASIEINMPFLMGGRETGISFYGELEDSEHFYRNREPEHQIAQYAFTHEVNDTVKFEIGGMYTHSEGYYQTPGWNRVTQDLVDNGTYITGRDTDMTDLDGNGRLTPNEVDAAVGTYFGASNIRTLVDFGVFGIPSAYELDTGVGTTQLDPRTVFLSEDDEVQQADSLVTYVDVIKEFDDSVLKFQLFQEHVDAKISQTTGFAAEHQMNVFEARLSYEFDVELSDVATMDVFVVGSHKTYDSKLRENFLSGYLVLDRRDLSVGAMPNDIFDTPMTNEASGIGIPWDTNIESEYKDTGIALVTDIKLWDSLGVILNARYDYYDYEATDTGTTTFGAPRAASGDEDDVSYNVSINYETPMGIVPYVTYAEGSSINTNSNGGISPGTIGVPSDTVLADTELLEIGVKASLLDGSLFASLAYYDQTRSFTDPFGNVSEENGEGWEAELRYNVTDNWAVMGAATIQEYMIAPPAGPGEGEYVAISPLHPTADPLFGAPIVTGDQGYGGLFAALNAHALPELRGGYQRKTIPENMYAMSVTYTSDEQDWGSYGATFGGTYVSETGGKSATAVVLPDYTLYHASANVDFGNFRITAAIKNLFDEEYFQPLQGVYEEVAILPGRGREWRLTGKMNF